MLGVRGYVIDGLEYWWKPRDKLDWSFFNLRLEVCWVSDAGSKRWTAGLHSECILIEEIPILRVFPSNLLIFACNNSTLGACVWRRLYCWLRGIVYFGAVRCSVDKSVLWTHPLHLQNYIIDTPEAYRTWACSSHHVRSTCEKSRGVRTYSSGSCLNVSQPRYLQSRSKSPKPFELLSFGL